MKRSFFTSLAKTICKNLYIQQLIMYAGLVSLVLFWPITDILLKNDSFRVIGGWSNTTSLIFILFFFIVPLVVLTTFDYILQKKYHHAAVYVHWSFFLIAGALLWTQFVNTHLNSFLAGLQIISPAIRRLSLLLGMLIVLGGIWKMKNYLPIFLRYLSLLAPIAIILIITQSISGTIKISSTKGSGDVPSPNINFPLYVMVFDGVSLPHLLDSERINAALFPTFSRISKEWTWYRNATTNSTATILSRPQIFSGVYYQTKKGSLGRHGGNLFENITSHSILRDFFSDMQTLDTIRLTKSLFYAYGELSLPTFLQPYLRKSPLESWRFDFRGQVPSNYEGRNRFYFGTKMKKELSSFMEDALNTQKARGSIYIFWSVISHRPYIFDEKGNLHEEECTSFDKIRSGTQDCTKEKVSLLYTKVLQYIDSIVNQFIEKLKEQGLYDDAVIFIISDHGMNEESGSNFDVNDEVARIPFFVKYVGLPEGTNDRDVQLIDVTPTILDILGIKPENSYDGQSLLKSYQKREKLIFAPGINGVWVKQTDSRWIHKR